ncbi:sulfotransferase domain-containing protein [Xanthomarina sp. F1114]|uniref:sulfotransferase domain-containing protein n=1 Tax=Xanthomarina sp. F1114 TaxID=2996019 RepID=UPI00225DEAC0|nr:sulfotransferase domain-containing protein [Xanthomarina sp. F1114]MCX7549064.1 sulfotransferase domain-containing protein [Xanthomarina sp. F1114]
MSKFNKHIIVVGSARSGTSWLGETLAQPFRYRMLFEPEQETRTKRGYLLCDQWLTSKAESPEAYTYLNSVFKNRVDCNWIAQNSNRKWKRHLWPFIPKKFIIKFVRCNLSAHFMNRTFDIPIIHIIRNPYDTIQSQQQVKFPWLYDLSHFAKQEKLVKLILDNYNYDLLKYNNLTDVEVLALRWCIENVIPLELLEPYSGKASVVKYEDLLTNMELIYELCETYNMEAVPNLQKHFKQPSSKTHPNSTLHKNNVEKKRLSKETLQDINTILNIFKTNLYSRRN